MDNQTTSIGSAADTSAKPALQAPSVLLLAAAIGGLFGLAGCTEEATAEADPTNCGTLKSPSEMVTNEVEATRTFADVQAECDARGGFTQVSAACAGVNACAGFSYGDWDPGVTSDHSCAAVNGCGGMSCVVLPADSGKTGKEVYEAELPDTGPRACTNCHADWSGDEPDMSKFAVWVAEGSTRDASNWLDYSAEKQQRIVAFGKQGMYDDGTVYSNMRGYHGVYSRAEIARVVDYVRTLEPMIKVIKTHD